MHYKIRKLRNKDEYIVKNSNTKQILSKHTSLENAKTQIKLLYDIDFNNKMKTIKFPINPFDSNSN
jgi:hypothetical protein